MSTDEKRERIIYVSNNVSLADALECCKAGDLIRLAPGVYDANLTEEELKEWHSNE